MDNRIFGCYIWAFSINMHQNVKQKKKKLAIEFSPFGFPPLKRKGKFVKKKSPSKIITIRFSIMLNHSKTSRSVPLNLLQNTNKNIIQ